MNKKTLVDKIISSLFRESRKVDTQRSYIAMRNYLDQLDLEQLEIINSDIE